jgi:hypothetical protein
MAVREATARTGLQRERSLAREGTMHVMKYECGEWKPESWGAAEDIRSLRTHLLYVVGNQDLDVCLMDLVRTVNADEFLGVAPGYLVCGIVRLNKTAAARETKDPHEIAKLFREEWKWCYVVEFVEQTPFKWNVYLHNVGPGKLEKRPFDLYVEVPFAEVFGQSEFPLS